MSTFLLSERGAARVSRLSRREEGEKDYDVEAIEEWCRPTQDPKVRGAATGRNDPLGSRAVCCTEGVVDDRHRHAEKGSSKGSKSNTEGVPQVVIDEAVAALNVPSRGGLLVLDDEDRIAEGHSGLQKIRVDSLEEERYFFVHRKEKDRLEKGSEEEGREGGGGQTTWCLLRKSLVLLSVSGPSRDSVCWCWRCPQTHSAAR
jgi:hypothetical protein